MKKALWMGLLFLGIQSAVAVERWHTAPIRWIYPQANGGFIITFTTESAHCTSTAVPKYYYVGQGYNGVSADGATKMYAAAMMAIAMGRQISIAFEDGTNDCAVNRIIVRDF